MGTVWHRLLVSSDREHGVCHLNHVSAALHRREAQQRADVRGIHFALIFQSLPLCHNHRTGLKFQTCGAGRARTDDYQIMSPGL